MTTRQAQDLLHYLGYNLTPDGVDGPETRAAIKAFQEDYGFQDAAVNGEINPATEMALKDSVAYDKFKPPDVSEPDTGTFWAEIPNFTRDEFKCKCGGRYCNGFPAEPKEAMVRLAQAARTHFGRPATVVSGLRCPQWNAIQGGVDNSQHMYGEACDIYISGVPQQTVLEWFLAQSGVRYAYAIDGSSNVHFDIPKGER